MMMSDAQEFECYPENDGKYFKFYRNVVRFTTTRDGPFTERKWRGKGKKEKGQISKSS